MIFEYNYKINIPQINPDKNRAVFKVKKMLPEYVFDTSQLENNPITFPEVKTLIDGISIGGHKISDVEQVLNIKTAWLMLIETVENNNFGVTRELFHNANGLIAREESLDWDRFRNGNVGIAGTKFYKAPNSEELDNIFDSELTVVLNGFNPVEHAIRLSSGVR